MQDKSLDDPLEIDEAVKADEYEQLSQADDFDRQLSNIKQHARQYFTYDQLVDMFALARLEADVYRLLNDETNEIFGIVDRIQELNNWQKSEIEHLCELVSNLKKSKNSLATQMFLTGVKTMEIKASKRGRKAADILHGKPGGNRNKHSAIRTAWATGNFSSRDICAEQECAGLNMSFSAARKALRGTPNPS